MKVKITFEQCGHCQEPDIDGSLPADRAATDLALRQGGELEYTGMCPSCKESDLRDRVDKLTHEQALEILHSVSSAGIIRRALGVVDRVNRIIPRA